VECGATPEVVHVLLVAYWPAVVARDNSGRTPLDILQDSELLSSASGESDDAARFSDISESKIIYQSLMKSQATYLQMQQRHEQQKSDLEQAHDEHVRELKQDHDQQLQQERGRHRTLEEKIEKLKSQNMALQHEVAKKDSKVLAFKNLEHIYQDRVDEQKSTVEALRMQLEHKDTAIEKLQQALQDKEAQILQEREHAAGLSHDVWHMTRLHDTQLQDVLQQAEHALQNLVHAQLAVHGQWLGQHRALHSILQQRGIPEPTPNAPVGESETAAGIAAAAAAAAAGVAAAAKSNNADEEREVMEEKKNEEEPMDTNAAAQVAAKAALQALQTADQRDQDAATVAAEAREPTDGAAAAGAAAKAEGDASTERELRGVDQGEPGIATVRSNGKKVKHPKEGGKIGAVPGVGKSDEEVDEDDEDDSDEDDDEEEEDGEEFDSEDEDEDDEEYDSQEETDEDSGISGDETSDEEDEELSLDEGEPAEVTSTLAKTDVWKKQ
jgi:hypothetical protein